MTLYGSPTTTTLMLGGGKRKLHKLLPSTTARGGHRTEKNEGDTENDEHTLSFFSSSSRSSLCGRRGRPGDAQKPHLDRAGRHLGLALDLKQLGRVYASTVWVWTPLNPSVLNDDNLCQLVQMPATNPRPTALFSFTLAWPFLGVQPPTYHEHGFYFLFFPADELPLNQNSWVQLLTRGD